MDTFDPGPEDRFNDDTMNPLPRKQRDWDVKMKEYTSFKVVITPSLYISRSRAADAANDSPNVPMCLTAGDVRDPVPRILAPRWSSDTLYTAGYYQSESSEIYRVWSRWRKPLHVKRDPSCQEVWRIEGVQIDGFRGDSLLNLPRWILRRVDAHNNNYGHR